MFHRRWFQGLVTIVLVFVLVLLISQTQFVFTPLFRYIGAVAIPFIGAGILFYITKPLLNLLEKIKIQRIKGIMIIFMLFIFLVVFFFFYILGILFYITKPLLNLLEKIKIPRIPGILIIFMLLIGLGVLFVLYIAPIVQNQFNNLIDNIPKMVKVSQDFIDDFQEERIIIPDQV